ncbi:MULTISPECIES: hypothetical protein [unclassified Sphingomonas]|uniref:hypothetical protein n=1 Tax=unclassified Sphingomonas TaxID=196159 RepID=UPI00226A26CE|nr:MULTISPECIES: hypothetical protein [unclassified Sphingomonas]
MFLDYGLLASEREVAYLLGVNIISLRSYAERFSDALALVDLLDENRQAYDFGSTEHRQFIKWKFIAVESGVIATYNAFECLSQIAKLYPKSDTISKSMDENSFKAATETFENFFPKMNKSVRTGIAHGAPAHESIARHRSHMPQGGPLIMNTLNDRTIQSTLHGGLLSFTIDARNSSALNSVATLTEKAFEGARQFTLQFSSVNQYDKENPVIIPDHYRTGTSAGTLPLV